MPSVTHTLIVPYLDTAPDLSGLPEPCLFDEAEGDAPPEKPHTDDAAPPPSALSPAQQQLNALTTIPSAVSTGSSDEPAAGGAAARCLGQS